MAWKFFLSLAAAAFAAILFRLFLRRGDRARSTDSSSGYDYEVFLSFRGPDTRAGFTDFLYTSLKDAGIRTFRDDEELRIGEKFAPELLQAIKQSKISIPIFSKGYASSPWCLNELVQMVECQKNGRQKIMPIFYDVAPSEVRHQIGGYAKAFHSHEKKQRKKQRYDEETIHEWKAALSAVGEINGWDLHGKTDRQEGEFVRKVTQKVFTELKKAYLAVSECLVSVDNHVDAIMEMIGAGTSKTRIIGIHGMGGIGKTTIAKIIYNKLSDDFDKCCFLQDIRETSKGNGIQYLQAQLVSVILKMERMDIKDINEGTRMIKDRLSNKKVLLLLDDAEEANHINALVGKRDWLGKGSKIIITTRKKDILEVPEVDCSYELKCMDLVQSLKLFSKHAFRRDYPLDEYIGQSNRAIDIAGGLPLALEVIGSLLCHTKKEKWDLTLKKLEDVPHAAVQSKLIISYDALDLRQQDIFLDIACLFIGYGKDAVVYFWDESKFPEEAIEVLQNMSLIKIMEDNKVWMHDQLRDLGREIVRKESKMKIEKQSRVWDPKEALDLLRTPEGRKEVEALRLKFDYEDQLRFTYEGFKSLSKLRFLEVDGLMEFFDAEERLFWHESPLNVLPTNVFPENSDLLPLLRWLVWHNIPPTFKIMNFSMENVVILDLSTSKITYDWEGWSHMKVMKNLKVLDLHSCYSLERTPNFSTNSKLERLILRYCCCLDEIDNSICQLESLVFLDVSHCRNLWRLPNTIGDLESLRELDIIDTGIRELPDSIGNLKSLIELNISRSHIKELPDSIGKLKNLKVVKMDYCSTSKIPTALWMIEKLEVIEARASCDFNVEIDNHIYRNQSMRILILLSCRIYAVPWLPESLTILELSDLYMNTFPDLSNLTNLKKLDLKFKRRHFDGESDGPVEKDLPRWIGNLSKLESLNLRSPYMTTLLTDISLLPQLKSLYLKCPNLRCLSSFPSSLLDLNLNSECLTTLPTDMSSLLPQLEDFHLWCPNFSNLHCLSSLPSSLSSLYLNSKCVTTLPTNMSSLLPQLKSLDLKCPNLRCLPSLPSSLFSLRLCDCESCCFMEDLSNLKTLSYLTISDCAITEIRGLDHLENLKDPSLCKLQQVKILPDLRNLNELWHLQVSDCDNLVEIQGELPSSLQKLEILGCGSLQKLPDLSSLKVLRKVEIKSCGKLNVKAISSLCWKMGVSFKGDDCEFECGLGCKFVIFKGDDCEFDCKFGCEFDSEFGCELEGEDDWIRI